MKAQTHHFPDGFNISIQPFALGERAGSLDLYIPGSSDYLLTSQASVDRSRAQSTKTLEYMQMFFQSPLDEIVVHHFCLNVRTLDSFGYKPAGIKIDVEEHELAVLRGGEQTIAKNHPLLIVETGVRTNEIAAFLQRLGYQRFLYSDEDKKLFPYGKKPLAGNTVFLTEHHCHAALKHGLL
jgi:FkbM family methyltransferase